VNKIEYEWKDKYTRNEMAISIQNTTEAINLLKLNVIERRQDLN